MGGKNTGNGKVKTLGKVKVKVLGKGGNNGFRTGLNRFCG
jgi:hypothetical protein